MPTMPHHEKAGSSIGIIKRWRQELLSALAGRHADEADDPLFPRRRMTSIDIDALAAGRLEPELFRDLQRLYPQRRNL